MIRHTSELKNVQYNNYKNVSKSKNNGQKIFFEKLTKFCFELFTILFPMSALNVLHKQ